MTGALIVTALLDPASQSRFDEERRRHFPAAINFIAAHVTLFHALPGAEGESVAHTLAEMCRGQDPATFRTTGLRFLGRGVAYDLDMPQVSAMRARLAGIWSDWLTPQDRQAFRPHVTVQNKVPPETARALLSQLQKAYTQTEGVVPALALWRYENGPWKNIATTTFG